MALGLSRSKEYNLFVLYMALESEQLSKEAVVEECWSGVWLGCCLGVVFLALVGVAVVYWVWEVQCLAPMGLFSLSGDIFAQLFDNKFIPLFLLVKNNKESKNILWRWEKNLSKS